MPKTKKTKTRVANTTTTKTKIHVGWLMATLLIAAVAIVGVVVIRLSQASDNKSIILRPSDPNVQVCGINPASQALHLCAGGFADTADGKAWRTSVNDTLGNFNWFGPYEKLTAWPDNTTKSVQACVTLRDNLPYGIKVQYVFDITADFGARVLATRTIEGQEGAFKTSPNSLTVQCLTANLEAKGFPADYNNVEYRIRTTRGSADIFNMTRTITGTVTSSYVPPAAKEEGMIWPVNANIAKMRGPSSPGGSGCYGAPRAGGRRHQGVDLIGTGNLRVINGNLYNDQIDVLAAKSGTVVNINNPADPSGYGNFIIIEHTPGELYTLYGHLSSISVNVGQRVNQGQVIGRTGEGGNAGPIQPGFVHTGNQVHFQVQNRYSGSAGIPFTNTIDPSSMISQPIDRNGC